MNVRISFVKYIYHFIKLLLNKKVISQLLMVYSTHKYLKEVVHSFDRLEASRSNTTGKYS